MEGISDIRICGIDETRPPRIRKEPYIDLHFKLSHKAPKEWCEDYNRLVARKKYPAKIDPITGITIDTWVRKPEEIVGTLDSLKEAVKLCNKEYIARIKAEAAASTSSSNHPDDGGEQGYLNHIIAGLNFDE